MIRRESFFTGHEHLDATYLIHMNGRVYDYRLGRFLSVDPIISNPASSQSINPYSYIGNNPLSGTDPTGYECVKTTGSNICGAEPIGNLSINGSPVVSGSNTMMGAVKDYLKQFTSGAKPQGTAQANTNTADQGGPTDTGKESGPSTEGFKNWISEKRAEFKGAFEDAFRKTFAGLNPYQGRNEIEAGARQDSAQRADALGTGMGGAAYDAAETAAKEGAILVVAGVAEKTAAEGLRALKAARGAATAEGGVAVLGHYPGYVNTAESIGARYFNVPAEVWARMSPAEQWAANAKFLDRLVMRGDTVILSTPASAARAGSWFSRELEYLSTRGYTLSADGTRMLPRGP